MEWALPAGVQAVCTTRVGGVSQAPFDGFNLGDHVQDNVHAVAQNRALLQAQLGGARPVFLSQVHGVDVAQLSASTPDGTKADACITSVSQVACTIMVADCLPVLFTDSDGTFVAAAHAGWRGLSAGVLENTVNEILKLAHQSAAADLIAWMGPAIGPDSFEVGEDVLQCFQESGLHDMQRCFLSIPKKPGKYLADIYQLARDRLKGVGDRKSVV